MKKKLTSFAMVIVLCFVAGTAISTIHTTTAEALPASKDCSLPYVSDVNDYGKRYVATIEVAGKPYVVKVWCGKKPVKVDQIGKHTWMMPFSKGKTYTIKAKAKHGKWKVIQYRLCKC